MFEKTQKTFINLFFDSNTSNLTQESFATRLVAFAIYLVALAIYTKKEK
jgi:hypothetical protein